MKIIILALLVSILSACAGTSGIRVVNSTKGEVPGDNLVHKISSGEVLYSSYEGVVSPSASIYGKFKIAFMAEGGNADNLILTTLHNNNESAYCGSFSVYTPGVSTPTHGCFIDTDKDDKFDDLIYSGARQSINSNPAYQKSEKLITGFKKEILFQGRTEKTIKLKYREFSNDIARPAFTEDIEYFISEDGTSSGRFKGLMIEIVSVDGNYIEYKVSGSIAQ